MSGLDEKCPVCRRWGLENLGEDATDDYGWQCHSCYTMQPPDWRPSELHPNDIALLREAARWLNPAPSMRVVAPDAERLSGELQRIADAIETAARHALHEARNGVNRIAVRDREGS